MCNTMNLVELTTDEFHRFCELIYRVAGIRIGESKRVMMSNRIRRRLRATGIKTFAEYYRLLTSPTGNAEMPLFLDAETYINVPLEVTYGAAFQDMPVFLREGLEARPASP